MASEELEARLWPNPARTELLIALESFAPNKKVELVLMTAEGRSLKAESLLPTVKVQQVGFDVRTFATGYYFIQIKQGAFNQTKRFMIIH